MCFSIVLINIILSFIIVENRLWCSLNPTIILNCITLLIALKCYIVTFEITLSVVLNVSFHLFHSFVYLSFKVSNTLGLKHKNYAHIELVGIISS